jgi:hypothetical protein
MKFIDHQKERRGGNKSAVISFRIKNENLKNLERVGKMKETFLRKNEKHGVEKGKIEVKVMLL